MILILYDINSIDTPYTCNSRREASCTIAPRGTAVEGPALKEKRPPEGERRHADTRAERGKQQTQRISVKQVRPTA